MNVGHLVYFKKIRHARYRGRKKKGLDTGLFFGILLGHLKGDDKPPSWVEYCLLLRQKNLVMLTDVEFALGSEATLKLLAYHGRKYGSAS